MRCAVAFQATVCPQRKVLRKTMPAEPFAQRSKTTDGGATWSASRVIFDPRQKDQTIANQIIVPTAGPAKRVLIDAFALLPTEAARATPA